MKRNFVLALTALAAALLAGGAQAQVCRYDVTPDATDGLASLALDVRISCDGEIPARDFKFGYRAGGFVQWAEAGALEYRIAVGALAGRRSPSDFAAGPAGVLAPIGAWLAAPDRRHGVRRLEIAFQTAPGVTPALNLAQNGRVHMLDRADWRYAGYSVFQEKPLLVAKAPGPGAFDPPGREGPEVSSIRIAVLDDGFRMTDTEFIAWIERFAGLTARFWAGFPSDHLLIAVTPGGRPGDPFGRVRGGGGATMMLRIDRNESPAFLNERDWVLTHEMIHLGAPFAPSRAPWFMEGMATYLEPLIRALGGATPVEEVWAEWKRRMPTGALGLYEEGLEGGGHPYWTGALFFLMAHVEYVRLGRTEALAQCFRAIRRDLGDASSRATVDDLIVSCDRAVGEPTLANLRERHRGPEIADLRELWRELGVYEAESGLAFKTRGASARNLLFSPDLFPETSP